jgi:hypothetical protein
VPLLGLDGVPRPNVVHRAQAQGDELGQMRMGFEHARYKVRALGRCHLGDMKRIDDIEI